MKLFDEMWIFMQKKNIILVDKIQDNRRVYISKLVVVIAVVVIFQ